MAENAAKPYRQFSFPSGCSLGIHHNDLTQMGTDAIVNAANKYLRHGGGVARAIVLRGGAAIQEESNTWIEKHGPINCDTPAYTNGGKMPCKYVIHAVGPAWGEGEEHDKLHRAITSALALADELKVRSIAFPAISTGIYGFPVDEAAAIFMQSIHSFLSVYDGENLRKVMIVLFGKPTLEEFLSAFDAFPWEASAG